MIIEIPRDYYNTKSEIYKAKQIDLNPGVTILVGCNGTGKSTFMKIIKDKCKQDDIPYHSYDGNSQGRSIAQQYAVDYDPKFLFLSARSSEGEWVLGAFNMHMDKLIKFVKGSKPNTDIVVLIDAVDSGLSIDAITNFRDLFDIMSEDCTKRNINLYLIISANNFEMAKDYDCVYPVTGEHMKFDKYEDYQEFIIKSAETRDARYHKAAAK